MNLGLKGYGENVATFIAASGVAAGQLVKITDDFTVSSCSSGDDIFGYCVSVRDGYAAVQTSGYIEVTVASRLTRGFVEIAPSSATAVAASENGKKYWVVCSTATTAGIIL